MEGPNHSGPIGWSMLWLESQREGPQLRMEHSWESVPIGVFEVYTSGTGAQGLGESSSHVCLSPESCSQLLLGKQLDYEHGPAEM